MFNTEDIDTIDQLIQQCTDNIQAGSQSDCVMRQLRSLNKIKGKIKASVDGPKLDAPAMIGSTRFGTGVAWSTVIERAQREVEYNELPQLTEEQINLAQSLISNSGFCTSVVDIPSSEHSPKTNFKSNSEMLGIMRAAYITLKDATEKAPSVDKVFLSSQVKLFGEYLESAEKALGTIEGGQADQQKTNLPD